jgi:hypothetical protein
MKKAKPRFRQFSRNGEAQSFADIPEQHVGALNLIDRRFESPRDSFLDETLLQPDAKVSADNFHDVFGFERSGTLQKLPQKNRLGGWPARGRNLRKHMLHFGQLQFRQLHSDHRETRFRLRHQRLGCDRSCIAMPAIDLGQLGFGFSRELANHPPQERTAHL